VTHLTKVLVTGLSVVDGDGEGDLFNVCGYLGQVDLDLLVIACACARAVVTEVLNSAGRVLQVAVEDEVFCAADLARSGQQESRRVEVKARTGVVLVDVPADADNDLGQSRIILGQADFL